MRTVRWVALCLFVDGPSALGFPLALTCCAASILNAQIVPQATTAAAAPEAVVRGYLDAFKALDAARMVSYWAEDAQVRRDGKLKPVNPDQADMRGFERATHTVWEYRIDRVVGESVTVTLVEENDFYRALGVGKRTQAVTCVVRNGKIVEIQPISMQDEHSVYRDEYRRFLAWLQQQPSGVDRDIVREGDFIFTYASGLKLQPWLERYRAYRKTMGDQPRRARVSRID